MYDMSKAGIKVFTYILSILKPNKDSFDFDYEDCMNFTNYSSKKTVLTGLTELLENQFIARGGNPYKYFINPTMFFNGDRVAFMKEYMVSDSPEGDKIQINIEGDTTKEISSGSKGDE
jgi:hypothetical protein